MKLRYIIIFLTFFYATSKSQINMDSLIRAAFLMKNDSNKIMQYIKIATRIKQQDPEKAILYLDTAKKMALTIGYKRGVGRSLIVKGDVLRLNGDLDSAFRTSLEALKIMESISDPEGISASFTTFANIAFAQGNYKEGLKWFLRSLELKEKLGDKFRIASAYVNIGLVYGSLNVHDSSEYYLNKAIIVGKEMKDDVIISTALLNYAAELTSQEKYEEALKTIAEALSIKTKIGDTEGFIIGSIVQTNCLSKLKREKETIPIYHKIIPLAAKSGFLSSLKDIYFSMTTTFEGLAQYDSAYYYYKKYSGIKDSILGQNTQEQINLLNKKFQLEQKDKEISLKNAEAKEQETKRKYLLLAVVLLISLIFVAIIALIKNNKSKNVIIQQKILVEHKQKEIIDSIKYAKRIQQSLLPTKKYIEKSLSKLKDKS